jgi:hypothetical protein
MAEVRKKGNGVPLQLSDAAATAGANCPLFMTPEKRLM